MQVTYRHKKEPTQWKELRSWKYTFIQLFVLSNSERLWNLDDLTSVILQKRCWNPEKTTKDFHCTHSCRAGNQITGPQQQWLPYVKIQQPRTFKLELPYWDHVSHKWSDKQMYTSKIFKPALRTITLKESHVTEWSR